MPHRTLRFCPTCKTSEHAAARDTCRRCGELLLPMLDEIGALSRQFLAARGSCCDNSCRNCPYREGKAARISPVATEKICGRCHQSLICQAGGCWCEKISLNPATLRWLQRTFTDCLCPACLAEFGGSATGQCGM